MSKMVELKLYSPLQVDVIDQDRSDHAVPLQAVNGELAGEYLGRIMNSFREIQPQEDARNAFIAPEQDWSEVCEKSFPSPVRWRRSTERFMAFIPAGAEVSLTKRSWSR